MNKTVSEGRAVCLADFFFFWEGGWGVFAPRMNTCGISQQIMTVILMLRQGQSIHSVSDRRSRRPSSWKAFLLKTHFYFSVVPKQGFYKTGGIATQAVCRIPLN